MLESILVVDELALLQRWRDGDREAGNELIHRHYSRIFKFVYVKVGGDEALTDDITQRVFSVLMGKDEPIERLHPYLRRIAYLMVLDHQRRANRFEITTASALSSGGRTASSLLSQDEQLEIMLRALRRLSTEDQLLLAYVYGDGRQQREIADELGVRVSQINGKVARARARLRRLVEEHRGPESSSSEPIASFDSWLDSIHAKAHAPEDPR